MNPRTAPVALPSFTRLRWPALLLVGAALVHPWDAVLADRLNPDRVHPFLDAWGLWCDHWSTRLILMVFFLTGFTVFVGRRWRRLRGALGAFGLAWMAEEVVVGSLKRLVGRPRPLHPDALGESIRALYDKADLKSFPSGHTAFAFAAAVVVVLAAPRRWVAWAAFLGASVIGLSRCYVGAHYASDVLAGAAIGWAVGALAWKAAPILEGPLHGWNAPRRFWPVSAVILMLTLGWLFKRPVRWIDPFAPESPLTGVRFPESLTGLFAAPVMGPARMLSSLPDAGAFVIDGACWLGVGVLVLLVFGRKAGRWAALGLTAWVAAAALLAFTGRVVQPPPRAEQGWIPVDLQIHIGDPVDGHVSLEAGVERAARLGFGLVQPTWHNVWARGVVISRDGRGHPASLFGMEWSDGPPSASPLHLLLYLNAESPPPVLSGEDWRGVIRRVHELGGLVVLSHGWRGDARRMPSLADLAAAGLDGVEVAGRNQEFDEDALARQAALRRFARDNHLLALANSDFHGKRSLVSQWTFLDPGETAGKDGAVDQALWEALTRRRDRLHLVVREGPAPPAAWPRWARPVWAAWAVFQTPSLPERAIWGLELVALAGAVSILRRMRRSDASTTQGIVKDAG